MPIIKSAIKKLRQDRRRTKINNNFRLILRRAVKAFKQKPSPGLLSQATSLLDKAAKRHIFHKNKTARLKSRLAQLVR